MSHVLYVAVKHGPPGQFVEALTVLSSILLVVAMVSLPPYPYSTLFFSPLAAMWTMATTVGNPLATTIREQTIVERGRMRGWCTGRPTWPASPILELASAATTMADCSAARRRSAA
jgi:hypothetical protein